MTPPRNRKPLSKGQRLAKYRAQDSPRPAHPGMVPTPVEKLVVVKGKVERHLRRQKPPNPYDPPPADPRGAAA